MAETTNRRIAGLSNGGYNALKRMMAFSAERSFTTTATSLVRRKVGTRSIVGFSHQSNSPAIRAAAAVAGSGTTVHSTRSNQATLGPAANSGLPSLRGT